MATDHGIYFEEAQDLVDVIQSPGFPQLRLHPALHDEARLGEIAGEEEQLLLAMHCLSDQLLVISKKAIYVYKIPRLQSGILRAGAVAAKIGIGFIPGVGELVEAGEKLMKPVEWVKGRKERKEDKLREQEQMPTKELIKIMRWDYRDQNTLKAILFYKERILLENGFEWKTAFKTSLPKPPGEPVAITVEAKGIRIESGKSKTFLPYLDASWDPMKIAADVAKCYRPAIEAAGWLIEASEQNVVFRSSK